MLSKNFHLDHNIAVANATDTESLHTIVVKFGKALGFDTVSATAVFDNPQGPSDFFSVDNTPAGYVQYWDDRNLGQLDPVMQHCKHNSHPIIWSRVTYSSKGMPGLWEHQAKFGYKTGIALAIHSIGGKHFFLGVDRDGLITESKKSVKEIISKLKLFAAHAEGVAYNIFNPAAQEQFPARPLTVIEIESLRWSMDGKSARDIADIMRITEAEAAAHLLSSMQKLRCVTKYQAVIKAIRWGILR